MTDEVLINGGSNHGIQKCMSIGHLRQRPGVYSSQYRIFVAQMIFCQALEGYQHWFQLSLSVSRTFSGADLVYRIDQIAMLCVQILMADRILLRPGHEIAHI